MVRIIPVENIESTSNKVTEVTELATNEQYPSAKAVYDALQNVEGGSGNTSLPPLMVTNNDGYASHTVKEMYEHIQKGGNVYFENYSLSHIQYDEEYTNSRNNYAVFSYVTDDSFAGSIFVYDTKEVEDYDYQIPVIEPLKVILNEETQTASHSPEEILYAANHGETVYAYCDSDGYQELYGLSNVNVDWAEFISIGDDMSFYRVEIHSDKSYVVQDPIIATGEEVERVDNRVTELENYVDVEVESLVEYTDAVARESSDHPGCFYRYSNSGRGYTVPEWLNPPMEDDVEYRTTERFLGKPVYTKVISGVTAPGNDIETVRFGTHPTDAQGIMPIYFKGTIIYPPAAAPIIAVGNLVDVCTVKLYCRYDHDQVNEGPYIWEADITTNRDEDADRKFYLTVKYIKDTDLLPQQYYDSNGIVNGITFTVNVDGTITANGTATADATFLCTGIRSMLLPEGQYAVSSGVDDSDANTKYGVVFGYAYQEQDRKTFNVVGKFTMYRLNEQALCDVSIVIRKGQTVNNLLFKPYLERVEDIS